MPRLRFLGSGDAFGSGGRYNTCFHLMGSETGCLIDCGASSMPAMRRFGVDPNDIDTIFISHLHGDHFGGLPFLVLDAQVVSRRIKPLTIAGPPGVGDRLMAAMEVFFPGSSKTERKFMLDIRELEPEQRATVKGAAVTPWVVRHPSGAPPFALRIEIDGKVLTYSGDTEWTEALIAAGRDADLFVCECYQFDKPVKNHLNYRILAPRLPEIGAKRVVLTHMSPAMLEQPAENFPGCELADDGKDLEF